MGDFHGHRQIDAAATEFFLLGPFAEGEELQGMSLVVGSTEVGRHIVSAALTNSKTGDAASLAAGARLFQRAEVALSDVVALAFFGQANASAVVSFPFRRLIEGANRKLVVGFTNGNNAAALDVIVSVWAGRPLRFGPGGVVLVSPGEIISPPGPQPGAGLVGAPSPVPV